MTSMETPERNTVFLSSLNVLIDELNRLVGEYKKAQLAFAHDIYTSGNAKVFDPEGKLQGYQDGLKIILDKLELQLKGLKDVRRDFSNGTPKQ